jgi:hypothetical protein
MIRRFLIALFVATAATTVLLAQNADVAGEWSLLYRPPDGAVHFNVYMSQTGTRLSGNMETEGGEFPLTGSVDGAKVTFTFTRPAGGVMLKFTFTGNADGDSMTGTMMLGSDGPFPFSAERTAH